MTSGGVNLICVKWSEVVSKVKFYQESEYKYSAWKNIFGECIQKPFASNTQETLIVIPMLKAGKLVLWKNFLQENQVAVLKKAVLSYEGFKQYKVGSLKYDEPIAHAMLTSNIGTGYRYHAVSMKGQPIKSIPVIDKLAKETSKLFNIEEWGIGVDFLVYTGTIRMGLGFILTAIKVKKLYSALFLSHPLIAV